MDKEIAYATLVERRRTCRRCQPGLLNPAQIDDGRYDSDEIGPWTAWQGSLDATLMVVGQDWGDVAYFRANEGRDRPDNPTNQRLRKLLQAAGYAIKESEHGCTAEGLFFTNAVLCLKSGGMGAKLKSAWFNECGTHFLRSQIELVRPRAVVTLGNYAYRAVAKSFGIRPTTLRDAVSGTSTELLVGVRLFPVYHCSARVLTWARTFDRQLQDWGRIGVELRRGVRDSDA